MQRRAVVTGASAGIGREIALVLAAEGVEVLAVARRASLLEALTARPNVVPVTADLATGAGIDEVAAAVGERPLAFLVHGAGVFPRGRLMSLAATAWREAFDVNVHARLDLVRRVRGPLAGGRGLFLGSDAAGAARAGGGAYSVSKAASEMLWRCLGAELGDEIAFGMLKPGLVATSMLAASLDAPRQEFPAGDVYAAMAARGEVIDPATVAAFCRFLLLEVGAQEFAHGIWDIRDAAHHPRWLRGSLYGRRGEPSL